MGILKRFKEVGLAFVPVILTIALMGLIGGGYNTSLLVNFAVGIVLVIVGEVVFLQGIDSSIMNMGELVGNASNRISKFFILLLFGFIFGFFTTLAEPSVQVLASQATEFGFNIPKFLLTFCLAFGTGICVALALFRIVALWNYKVLIAIFYSVIFLVAFFVKDSLIAIAFDGGGATISNIASPFLLALAAGVARNKAPHSATREANFGMIGIASMGPILAVLILGLFYSNSGGAAEATSTASKSIWLSSFFDISMSIVPLVSIFFVFQAMFFKISKTEKFRILLGTAVTFVGLYLFLVGIEFGFLDIAHDVGHKLFSVGNNLLTFVICAVLSFSLCYTEPAVSILASQVEELTNGNIRSKLVLFSIALSFMIAVILSVLKVLFNLRVFTIIIIGYAIVFVLMIFCSKTFTSIAFDSGGVASGPMTSSFIMPLLLGLAGVGNEMAGFGVLAFVAMTPIIVMETLGVVYEIQIKKKMDKERRRRKALAKSEDELSNMRDMEIRYLQLMEAEKR